MYLKMLVKDYKRKKVVTIVLFLFILLAATLAAAGMQMFLSLTGAMDNMFRIANTPHYIQYHNGSYDEEYVRRWIQNNPYIKEWSSSETLIPGDASLYVNGDSLTLDVKGSEVGYVTQKKEIDILLNLDNEVVNVQDGQIAVPIIFMQWSDLKIGDTLTICFGEYQKTFVINDFLRDPIYGSTMMSSKRIVLSDSDYAEMKHMIADGITSFSFILYDESQLSAFSKDFQSSDMPQNSFFVDMSLIRLSYSVANGITIGLVLLCSFLLVLIAFLTLRYTILSTIEEDFREIGVMKAIGFNLSGIIRLYISKYVFLSIAACAAGLGLGQLLLQVLNANLLLYLGTPDNGTVGLTASIGAVMLILAVVLLFCLLTLRRIGRMTVIDAIRAGNIGETYSERKWLALSRRRMLNVNILIGIKEVFLKLRVYILLFIVYLLCTFICILPINVKNTLAAPETVGYMGMPVSDLFIYTGEKERVDELAVLLDQDADVTKWALYVDEQYKIKNADGQTQYFRTTVGDQALFPPVYSSGTPPVLPNEIALSYLLAKDLGKSVGDSVFIETGTEERSMLICGIFQDVSNGGRSMRSCLELGVFDTFYWMFNVCINGDATAKASEYKNQLSGVTITTLDEQSEQYIGETVRQMDSLGILLAAIAMLVSALITALFVKMLTAKETSQIAVMKNLGFSQKHIRLQYITRIGLILLTGILSGTLLANIGGERIMSLVIATMGAPVIKLIIKPVEVYAVLPILLLAAVNITILLGCQAIRKISISQINAE